jgi:hypothetical protein
MPVPAVDPGVGDALAPPSRLGEFAGDYYSEELGAVYRIVLEGTRLTLSGGGPVRTLFPEGRDRFAVGGQTLRFLRDTRGRLTGMVLDVELVRNLMFLRR